jgi:hypothetical protein
MLAEEQVIERIYSAGQVGIKKNDLRKEFAQPEIDTLLQKLTSDGQIFIDKKGTAYYCWVKENYLQYLLNSDPRFRLTQEAIHSLEQSIHKNTDRLAVALSAISVGTSSQSSDETAKDKIFSSEGMRNEIIESHINYIGLFKDKFDDSLANFSTSIGWVELGKIRNDLCKKHRLTTDNFYDLVGQLIAKYPNKYELSSGGYEGITVRGLLHGFVRSI